MKRLAARTIGKRECRIDFLTQNLKYPAFVEATAMSFKIDFDRDLEYVSMSVRGALNMSQVRICRCELQEVLRVFERTRVLLDTSNVLAKLSAIDDYNFIKELRHEFPTSVSMALVVSPERTTFGRFIETAAVNNDVRLRSFTDRNEAVTWLKKQN
jgi:hypothetical protein